jgi:cytochrome oxidase Cu insertion factor (SCO1/SenC/PrrC family)
MNPSINRAAALMAFVIALTAMPQAAQAAPAPAPAFALELFNGQTLRLADLKGKPVILLFWAEW